MSAKVLEYFSTCILIVILSYFYQQIIDTFPPNSDSIWDEIDLLEGDPLHRGAALRNLKFKPFWLAAEEAEWAGLSEKGVFKRWNKSDLLKNDRVYTSRYVFKSKRNAKTGAAYRFKARMCVRGFEMVKGLDYEDNFSPTPMADISLLLHLAAQMLVIDLLSTRC